MTSRIVWCSLFLIVYCVQHAVPQARVICTGNRLITNIMYRARDTWAPRIAADFNPLYLKDVFDIGLLIFKNSRFYNASNVYLRDEVEVNCTDSFYIQLLFHVGVFYPTIYFDWHLPLIPAPVGKVIAEFDDIFGDVRIQFARVRNASVKASVNYVKLITAHNQRLTFRGLGPVGPILSTSLNVLHRVVPQVILIIIETIIRNMLLNFFDNYGLPV